MSPRAAAATTKPAKPVKKAKKPARRKADPVKQWANYLRRYRPGLQRYVLDALTATYGEQVWEARLDPTSELILTILTQNTADTNAEKAYEALRRAYPSDREPEVHKPGIGWGGDGLSTAPPPDWSRVEFAPLPELIDVIRPGGLGPAEGAADPGDAPAHPRGARRLLAGVPRRPARPRGARLADDRSTGSARRPRRSCSRSASARR